MLVLSRRVGEEIVIGGNVRVTVLEVRGSQVRLGIVAPQDVRVLRQEIEHRSSQLANAQPVLSKNSPMSRSDSRIMAGLIRIAR